MSDERDALRYRWLRDHMGYLLVGAMTYEGDSLGDLSSTRVDELVDREVRNSALTQGVNSDAK